tara:strand:- start:40 stop:405 length:366 start_codon:yes stop_codon:yes gene_type:complete
MYKLLALVIVTEEESVIVCAPISIITPFIAVTVVVPVSVIVPDISLKNHGVRPDADAKPVAPLFQVSQAMVPKPVRKSGYRILVVPSDILREAAALPWTVISMLPAEVKSRSPVEVLMVVA